MLNSRFKGEPEVFVLTIWRVGYSLTETSEGTDYARKLELKYPNGTLIFVIIYIAMDRIEKKRSRVLSMYVRDNLWALTLNMSVKGLNSSSLLYDNEGC